jgi:hypothetical protein
LRARYVRVCAYVRAHLVERVRGLGSRRVREKFRERER